MYNEKQVEYNDMLARCNEQLKIDKSSNDSDSTQELQSPLKTLPTK